MSHTLINCTCKIDLVSLYFRLLWYHSILRGSIDQKHANTNEIWRQNGEIHSALVCSHWPPWLPNLFNMREVWRRETYVQSQSLSSELAGKISPRRANKDSNIPSPERTRSAKCPTLGLTKTVKSPPPYPASPPPPLPGFTLIGA